MNKKIKEEVKDYDALEEEKEELDPGSDLEESVEEQFWKDGNPSYSEKINRQESSQVSKEEKRDFDSLMDNLYDFNMGREANRDDREPKFPKT